MRIIRLIKNNKREYIWDYIGDLYRVLIECQATISFPNGDFFVENIRHKGGGIRSRRLFACLLKEYPDANGIEIREAI